jgi:hypothetical protein
MTMQLKLERGARYIVIAMPKGFLGGLNVLLKNGTMISQHLGAEVDKRARRFATYEGALRRAKREAEEYQAWAWGVACDPAAE